MKMIYGLARDVVLDYFFSVSKSTYIKYNSRVYLHFLLQLVFGNVFLRLDCPFWFCSTHTAKEGLLQNVIRYKDWSYALRMNVLAQSFFDKLKTKFEKILSPQQIWNFYH